MTISLLGIPLDANSSHLFGAAKAPDAIRTVLHSGSGNHVTEHGIEVVPQIEDLGNLELDNVAASTADADAITDRVTEIVAAGQRMICLGGDHSVTFPILRGFAALYEQLTVVHIDAHPDGLDPSVAPGVSHHEPGGLTFRELLDVIDSLRDHHLVGADIVELNPDRDVVDMTAAVAAKLLKEVAGAMLS